MQRNENNTVKLSYFTTDYLLRYKKITVIPSCKIKHKEYNSIDMKK